ANWNFSRSISAWAVSASCAIAAMMRFSAAVSSGRLSGVIGTPAVDQICSLYGSAKPGLSQFAAVYCQTQSAGQLGPPGSPWHPPVDPLEQHRELRPAQHHHALLGARPDESPPLQPFGEQAQPVTIPPQQLDQITAAAPEAKHVTGKRILPEHRLRLRRQTVEPLAHVSSTGRQPHSGARRQTVHRSSSTTCRSVSELTSPRRRTRAPQPNTISMTPSRSARRGRSPSGAISTGTITLLSIAVFGNNCRRHRNSWLLFTSCRRAPI